MPHLTIEQAIQDIKDGKMVILVDDEDRENEGDLCMAAEKVTPEAINFMATHGRGLVCLTMTPQKCDGWRVTIIELWTRDTGALRYGSAGPRPIPSICITSTP